MFLLVASCLVVFSTYYLLGSSWSRRAASAIGVTKSSLREFTAARGPTGGTTTAVLHDDDDDLLLTTYYLLLATCYLLLTTYYLLGSSWSRRAESAIGVTFLRPRSGSSWSRRAASAIGVTQSSLREFTPARGPTQGDHYRDAP